MFLRLIRDWKGYRSGKVFEPQPSVASILLRRKIAEPAEPAGDASPEKKKRKRA